MKELADLQPKPRHLADMANHSMSDGTARSASQPSRAGLQSSARPVATRPFAAFEWMIALRYLRAKRAESFVSVISGFSLVGIALGVATLIIVMSVMNGFRHELLKSILGINGHVTVQAEGGPLPDFDALTQRLRAVPGVTRAAPVVDGQVMASQNGVNSGVIVRGLRTADLKSLTIVSK